MLTIDSLIAVISLVITCIGFGYAIGHDEQLEALLLAVLTPHK